MPRGDKAKYTDKQKRQAEHIEGGYKAQGLTTREAERRVRQSRGSLADAEGRKEGGGQAASRPRLVGATWPIQPHCFGYAGLSLTSRICAVCRAACPDSSSTH